MTIPCGWGAGGRRTDHRGAIEDNDVRVFFLDKSKYSGKVHHIALALYSPDNICCRLSAALVLPSQLQKKNDITSNFRSGFCWPYTVYSNKYQMWFLDTLIHSKMNGKFESAKVVVLPWQAHQDDMLRKTFSHSAFIVDWRVASSFRANLYTKVTFL